MNAPFGFGAVAIWLILCISVNSAFRFSDSVLLNLAVEQLKVKKVNINFLHF
jgi:hypothetical protein